MPGTRHCVEDTNGLWPPPPGKAGEDSLRWGGGWERRAPPAREGRGAVLPLVVAAGSEACRRTGSPLSLPPAPCLLPSAPFPLLGPPPPGSPPIPRIHLRRSWTRTPLSGRRPRGKALHSDLCFPHWLLTVRTVNLHALSARLSFPKSVVKSGPYEGLPAARAG